MRNKQWLIPAFFLLTLSCIAQPGKKGDRKVYSIEQATSDRAQLHTIAFNGLAFVTGSFGADCFFPPGKVADFFGFQYMRDNDSNQLGHNTDFLTRIANNVISILDQEQLGKLKTLAVEQESIYTDFAKKRMVLIKAFRQSFEDRDKKQAPVLNKEAVQQFGAELYALDGALSYGRAEVLGAIIRSFTPEQQRRFNELRFSNSDTWPVMEEKLDKRSLSHRAHVGVMTYASELFSWYKGSLTADIYFCPERHGTYFGGFYLKDYPAMHNPGYFIPTALTGESGASFLQVLNPEQRKHIEALLSIQRDGMKEIVQLRTEVSTDLRGFISGNSPEKEKVMGLIRKYGEQDALLSYYYVTAFTTACRDLTPEQKEQLIRLRNLDKFPEGTYLYSDPIPMPDTIDCTFLFRNPGYTAPGKATKAF
jgi:Spy/CpxP family protein refolding chaperone